MRYLMLVCVDSTFVPSPEEQEAIREQTDAWVEEMDGRGVRQEGSQLAPPEEARTVRRRDGDLLVSDGPFAETKELIAGYDLLECADLDEAIEVAAKHPMARHGALDIRPLWNGGDGEQAG